jgi:uncharacterized protein (AIM24 family)
MEAMSNNIHSIAAFIATHADKERDAGPFEVENRSTLQVNLQGTVYAKAGAMVACRGEKFSRKGDGWVMVQPYEEG